MNIQIENSSWKLKPNIRNILHELSEARFQIILLKRKIARLEKQLKDKN